MIILDSPLVSSYPAGTSVILKQVADFDCLVGVKNWERGWSGEKKGYCCEVNGIGCYFDCAAGYDNWERGWSDRKKQYCCHVHTKGCQAGIPRLADAASWPDATPGVAATPEQAGLPRLADAASSPDAPPLVKAWAPPPEAELESHDCKDGLTDWARGWSDAKKKYCCDLEGTGCYFDCMAGIQQWEKGWSEKKQSYCCEFEGKGCPGYVYTGDTPAPTTSDPYAVTEQNNEEKRFVSVLFTLQGINFDVMNATDKGYVVEVVTKNVARIVGVTMKEVAVVVTAVDKASMIELGDRVEKGIQIRVTISVSKSSSEEQIEQYMKGPLGEQMLGSIVDQLQLQLQNDHPEVLSGAITTTGLETKAVKYDVGYDNPPQGYFDSLHATPAPTAPHDGLKPFVSVLFTLQGIDLDAMNAKDQGYAVEEITKNVATISGATKAQVAVVLNKVDKGMQVRATISVSKSNSEDQIKKDMSGPLGEQMLRSIVEQLQSQLQTNHPEVLNGAVSTAGLETKSVQYDVAYDNPPQR